METTGKSDLARENSIFFVSNMEWWSKAEKNPKYLFLSLLIFWVSWLESVSLQLEEE